jgi:hypothetical protein
VNAESVRAGKTDGIFVRQVDDWSSHLWHTSQHNRMVIGLAGRLQALANEMRVAAGLEEFGWNTSFPDERFGECSVHVEGCAGQETHIDGTVALFAGVERPPAHIDGGDAS